MGRRCRSCGRTTRTRTRTRSRTRSRRHSRTVFSQPGFWLLVIVAVLILYATNTGRA